MRSIYLNRIKRASVSLMMECKMSDKSGEILEISGQTRSASRAPSKQQA